LGGGEPSAALNAWLSHEGLDDVQVNLWIARPQDPPDELPAGPWVVVAEAPMEEIQKQRWLARLDEESSLLAPWTPATLRPALRRQPLDSSALARLYSQGGRALADHMVRNFLQHSPGLLQMAQSDWQEGNLESAQRRLHRLRELAGGVGASDLQSLLDQVSPDWDKLQRELEAARRVLDQQHRQDRTV
jgi:HPt (histidine-containing phosphotransfer) domain-containing protein